MRQLSSSIQIQLAANAQAAGQTAVTAETLDTQGYESLCLVATLGAVTATGTITLKAQGGEASDGSDKADIAGASVVANDTHSNKLLVLEIHRPKQRYITPVLTRATANSVIQCVHVLLGNPSLAPVEQPDVANRVVLNAPKLA